MMGNFSSEENFVEVKGLHQSRDVGARSACRFLMWQFSTADIVVQYIWLALILIGSSIVLHGRLLPVGNTFLLPLLCPLNKEFTKDGSNLQSEQWSMQVL